VFDGTFTVAAGMLTSPESPTFLLSKGKPKDAEKAAEALWGPAFRSELYGAAGVVADVGKMVVESDIESAAAVAQAGFEDGRSGGKATEKRNGDVSWGEMLSGTNRKLLAVACSLFLIQQFSGINAIVYFSSSVFRDAGVGSETLASVAVGLVNVLGTVVAASLMDKAGRKCASALLAAAA
jgi:hypothetical protein